MDGRKVHERVATVSIGQRVTSAELSRVKVALLSCGTLALVGALDALIGHEISFGVFYLTPVSIAAWYAGRRWGIAFALLCSVVWFVVEWNGGYSLSNAAIPVWNAFVRLVFFLVVALLLAALHAHLQKESQLASTDPLTGLLNGRAFRQCLTQGLAVTERNGGALTLAYVDVDDFKRVNDNAGHGEGDRLLRTIADRLTKGTRRADTVARLGGDEFGLVLPATDLDGAETLLLFLSETLGQMTAAGGPVTCSIGAAVFHALPEDVETAIAAADRLMYEAKKCGGNTLVAGLYSTSHLEVARDHNALAEETRVRVLQ